MVWSKGLIRGIVFTFLCIFLALTQLPYGNYRTAYWCWVYACVNGYFVCLWIRKRKAEFESDRKWQETLDRMREEYIRRARDQLRRVKEECEDLQEEEDNTNVIPMRRDE